MDEDLTELERRAAADPSDAEVASRLDQALLRAGRAGALAKRYRFKFRCPLRFDDLPLGRNPLTRDCDRCERTVHLVLTPEQLAQRVAVGDCVAFPRGSLAAACVELARDPRIHSAEEAGPLPCVQDSDVPFVDLDAVEIPERVQEMLPAAFALTYRVVPVAYEDDVLHVACADPLNPTVLDDLRFMLNLRVELVLATPEAVERAVDRLYPDDPRRTDLMMMGDVLEY